MKYLNVEASQHEMKLVQMGAKVEQINSKMCYIKFTIDSIPIEYVYNLNKKNKFFLERIEPYPMPVRSFEKESDIVNIIEVDIKQFKNATKSKNIESFLEINNELNDLIKKFEDLYLYYNVPAEKVEFIKEKLQEIQDVIMTTKDNTQRVFFEKEPDHLK